ncbi:zinc finger BED domain-containing protein RICESLEEPER 2-like [Morus notabilis]|uniref:zinc finger BED domain-containing protein RICESLEEPER 2-like n=1 Tax=Morus notabilis TaxID=981085 RepID=UPI000CECE75A|nr:zinc finger BED domain-containing protein RICESLEEPER 2-like [Morus notabilis]
MAKIDTHAHDHPPSRLTSLTLTHPHGSPSRRLSPQSSSLAHPPPASGSLTLSAALTLTVKEALAAALPISSVLLGLARPPPPSSAEMSSSKKQKEIESQSSQKETETTETQETTKEEGECTKKRKKARQVSPVWLHFTRDEKTKRATCKHCGVTYAADSKKNGTSIMKSHIESCLMNPESENKQKTIQFSRKIGAHEEDTATSTMTLRAWSKEGYKRAVSEYIVLDELPFRHVEGKGFKRYSAYLNPRVFDISRIIIASDVYQMFLEEKKKLKKVLGKQRKMIINFIQVPNHKGETVAQEILVCLNNWGITTLFTVTVDNATSNDVAMDMLKRKVKDIPNFLVLDGQMKHMRCVCHILNLIVNDGLTDLAYSIASIRNAVRYVRSSPQHLKKFKECMKEENINLTALLCLDVKTRWNSTYLMLETSFEFVPIFERLLLDQNNCAYFDEVIKDKKMEGPPNETDWDNARLEECDDPMFNEMETMMNKKFDKYWGNVEKMNHMMFLGLVLDPRYKLDYLVLAFKCIYNDSTSVTLLKGVEDTLRRLYKEYHDRAPPPPLAPSSPPPPNSTIKQPQLSQLAKPRFRNTRSAHSVETYSGCNSSPSTITASSEPASMPVIDDEIEAMFRKQKMSGNGWWKVNAPRYKVLSQIARDVLAVLVSTVASESAFSTCRRILDPLRSSLAPRMVEALICLKSWLNAKDEEYEPVVLRQYMDEVESFADCYHVVSSNANHDCTYYTYLI